MSVHYTLHGDGKWYEHKYSQCQHDVFAIAKDIKCQGVEGHDGPHWAYAPDGDLHQDYDPPVNDIAASQTPDGHASYVRPLDMRQHHYTSHVQTSEVTDPVLLERLGPTEREPEWSKEELQRLAERAAKWQAK